MKLIQIPKRSGGTRTIAVPSRQRKASCRAIIPMLQRLVAEHCNMEVVHGFAEMRSPVTNALKHVGYAYTLGFDLQDFFDSVQQKMPSTQLVHPSHSGAAFRSAWHKGVARQGLPTSPIIANLAARGMDAAILKLIEDAQKADASLGACVYTRYADDLSFSFQSGGWIDILKKQIPLAAHAAKFKVNDSKTELQHSKSGRRIVTGVAVDDTGVHPTRAAKRRLRAARHNAAHGRVKHFPARQWVRHVKSRKYNGQRPMHKQAWLARWLWQRVAGLEEWCRLKVPVRGRRSAERILNELPSGDALVAIANRPSVATTKENPC